MDLGKATMRINVIERLENGTPILMEVVERCVLIRAGVWMVSYKGQKYKTEKIAKFRGQSIDTTPEIA